MSDKPFGFGFPADDDDAAGGSGSGSDGSGGTGGPADPFGFGPGAGGDPFSALLGGLGAGGTMNPADLGAAFARLGQLLSYEGGPVNWDLARDTARAGAAAGNDRFVGQAQHTEVSDAVRLAEVWLDAVTALPAGATSAVAWSRAEWVEGTLPAWKQLVEPVAAKVVAAMGSALTGGDVPEEMRAQVQAMAGPLQQMMASMGGAMFGAQVGQAIGTLAGEVVGSTDIGLPLGPAGKAVLVPANVAEFGEGLGLPPDQIRLYLALREAAHQRLYAHVPWLRGHVQSALEDYAQGITIDTSRIQEQLSGIDPSDPAAVQQALGEGLFEPQDTPAQTHALRRLEGLLAVIEGWVDQVVDAAAAERLPSAAALRETIRRRRATGGPAEQTFAALVGLELRPRRLREAADLWAALAQERGIDGRDAVWAHPDLVPTVDDLEDPAGPAGFLTRGSAPLDLSGLDELGAAPDEGTRPDEDPRPDGAAAGS